MCVDCRLACEEITGALTMVNDAVPEPPDGFERVVWARVQQAIALAPAPSRWTWRSRCRRAPWLRSPWRDRVRCGARSNRTCRAPAATDCRGAGRWGSRPRALTALDNHFRQTEMLLVELRNASDRDSLDFERFTAEELVSAGRLYRQTAESAGHPRLVRMLDDLEPVLVEVARGPERRSSNDRAWLRARIDDDNLLFKVRAATNDIRERVAHADQ